MANQVFLNPKYQTNFFTELEALYRSQSLTDIELNCSDNQSSIRCHKLVLASLSPYFRAMFTSGFTETEATLIQMPETDHSTLTALVEYAYTGTIELTLENIQNIFTLGNLLQLTDLVTACSDYMNLHLDLNNALQVLEFARCHQVDGLVRSSKHFVVKNFMAIVARAKEFLDVKDVDMLIDVLSSDELSVDRECDVMEAILKWINGDNDQSPDKDPRESYFETLFLPCVRLPMVDNETLRTFYKENFALISTSLNCINRIENHLNGSSNKNSQKPRCGKVPDHCFLIVGGNCDLDDGVYVNCFSPHLGDKFMMSRDFQEKSKPLRNGYFHVENPGVCVTDRESRVWVAGGNYVYHEYKCVRGRGGKEADGFQDGEELLSKEVFEFDPKQDTWLKRASMLFAKANFSMCSMDGRIYAFGGITVDQDQLDIVEFYDLAANAWNYAGVMPSKFIAGCVVRHEDSFYVMGGRSGVGRFDNCYQFRPSTNEWTELSRMHVGRFNFGACLVDEKIYAFGGQRYNEDSSYYTREALDSVEVYDLNTKQWSLVDPMPAPLYNTAVCQRDANTLYLAGTTECKFSGNTLIGFMFTSVFRLQWTDSGKANWTVVEHEVTDIKSNYRCVSCRIDTEKLYKCATDLARL